MTALRDAVAFLTRLPVGLPGGHRPERLARALAWFPAVGLLVGLTVGGVRSLGGLALPVGPATVLAVLAGMAVTGALHEDGLADTADGLGANATRERRLEIMRDPRVGTYGALALIGATLLAVSLLAALGASDCLRAALVGHTLARWSVLPQAAVLRPARRDGIASQLQPTPISAAWGSLVAIAVSLTLAGPLPGALALGVAAVATVVSGAVVTRRLGGVTGDTYGLTIKLVELSVIAVLVAAWQ